MDVVTDPPRWTSVGCLLGDAAARSFLAAAALSASFAPAGERGGFAAIGPGYLLVGVSPSGRSFWNLLIGVLGGVGVELAGEYATSSPR